MSIELHCLLEILFATFYKSEKLESTLRIATVLYKADIMFYSSAADGPFHLDDVLP